VLSFLFALIVGPILYSLVVFRRRKGDTTDGVHMEGNASLEIGWTVAPLILVVVFAYWGSYSLGEVRRVDPHALVVNVRASQWVWVFEYPNTGILSEELHLPVDQQVVLKMQSADVIHSFWVPEFRIKQDVVPGRITEYRVTPSLIGNYKVRCAELCGTSHYSMETREKYDAWIAAQTAIAAEKGKTPEGQGQILTVRNGCVGCHTIDGSPNTGPTWLHLYGEEVPLNDGTTVVADDAYITESIHNPNAKIVDGFPSPSPMPVFDLTDEQIANIIAYIKTLK
jgi:cytochrome c oxidase subunit 2